MLIVPRRCHGPYRVLCVVVGRVTPPRYRQKGHYLGSAPFDVGDKYDSAHWLQHVWEVSGNWQYSDF